MVSLGIATQVRRVTAVLLGRIGDVIVATPFLRSLRWRYPNAHLRLALNGSCAGLLPMIAPGGSATALGDWTLLHPWYLAPKNLEAALFMRAPRSDLIVDLNPSPSKSAAALVALGNAPVKLGFRKTRLNGVYTHQIDAAKNDEPMLDRYARLAAALEADYEPRPVLTVHDWHVKEARELLRPLGFYERRTNVVIHPGNFKKFDNRWPEEKFVELTNRLLDDRSLTLYYMAGPGERSRAQAVVGALKRPVPMLPEASLLMTAGMLKHMTAFLGNITGTTHLATAVGTPTFGLYSGYTHAVWRPRQDRCGGAVSSDWESCRSIDVDRAHAEFKRFIAQLSLV